MPGVRATPEYPPWIDDVWSLYIQEAEGNFYFALTPPRLRHSVPTVLSWSYEIITLNFKSQNPLLNQTEPKSSGP